MRGTNTGSGNGGDWTRDELLGALNRAGWSLRKLALHHGLNPSTLRQAVFMPYPRGEQRIAAALGLAPQQIWPSRYDRDGNPNRALGRNPSRLPPVIPAMRRGNRSSRTQAVNGNRKRAN